MNKIMLMTHRKQNSPKSSATTKMMCGNLADAASDDDGSDKSTITVITSPHAVIIAFVIVHVCQFIISVA